MLPNNEKSNQKPKAPTPSTQQQPCSSSLPPNPNLNPNPSHPLPNSNSNSPPRHDDAETGHQQLTALDVVISLLLDDPDIRYGTNGNGNGESFLKRGPLDFFGRTFTIDDFASIKRTKLNNQNDDRFELQNPDPKGKRKLLLDDDSSNSNSEKNKDHHHQKRKDPLIEINFFSNASRQEQDESESTSQEDSDSESDDSTPGNDVYPPDFGQKRRQFMEENKRHANYFAREKCRQDFQDVGSSPVNELDHEIDGCPTPFSLAIKAIKERMMKNTKSITWVSKKNMKRVGAKCFSVPSLKELCLNILANNADKIVSLNCVPDELRHQLSQLLCDSRKMNNHFLELLVSGSPTQIRLKDCSWLTEEQFTKCFQTCDTAMLEVLQLDQCGRCISDYALHATLAQSPRWLPRLTFLSVSGACRLSDKGLQVLVSSTPALRSVNLSQCSLLTSASLNILADSLGSRLKELYLDDCLMIDAAKVVPALQQLEHLEVLSLAGIQTVCDEFIKDYIIALGHNMKELVLKGCINLTDASMKVIAERCPGLRVLDLTNLIKLTDLSIGYLANSCQALHTLKLCRNPFRDEAIAAFLETTGESLKELSLNNIKKVGDQTTLSLASCAKNLHTLDLSWCRNLTDKELGLIVDSCTSLKLLKLFGCTQVTDVFLNGHSNPEIQIIGSKMSTLLQHVKMPNPIQGALRYSSASVDLI